uniref:uncharacterized protein LOC120325847 n=1 Tax=Styela clava TaxID=7725 RepID=UPI00193AC013|nr:uncharacterized protein LOC120325847 [Styela clava]
MSWIFEFLHSILRKRIKFLIIGTRFLLVLTIFLCGLLSSTGDNYREKGDIIVQQPQHFPSSIGVLNESYVHWNNVRNDNTWMPFDELCRTFNGWSLCWWIVIVPMIFRTVRWLVISHNKNKFLISAIAELKEQASDVIIKYKIRRRLYKILKLLVRIWFRRFRGYKKSRKIAKMRKAAWKYVRQAQMRQHRIASKKSGQRNGKFIGNGFQVPASKHCCIKSKEPNTDASLLGKRESEEKLTSPMHEALLDNDGLNEKNETSTGNHILGDRIIVKQQSSSENRSIRRLAQEATLPHVGETIAFQNSSEDQPDENLGLESLFGQQPEDKVIENLNVLEPTDENMKNFEIGEVSSVPEQTHETNSSRCNSDMYLSDTSSFDSQNTSDCDLPSHLEWTESENDSDNFYKYEDNYRRVASSSSFERPTTLPEYLKQQISKQNDCVYDGTSYGSIVYSDDSFPSSISIRSYNSKIEESSLEEISFECPQRMPSVTSGIFLPTSGSKFKQIQNRKYLPMPNSQVCKALKIKIPSVRRDSCSEYSEPDSRSARSKLSSSADVDLSTAGKNASPQNQDNCDSINKTELESNEKLEEFDQNSCTSSIVMKMQQEEMYSKKEETIVSNKNNGSVLKYNLEALRHNLSRMDDKQRKEFIFKYEVDPLPHVGETNAFQNSSGDQPDENLGLESLFGQQPEDKVIENLNVLEPTDENMKNFGIGEVSSVPEQSHETNSSRCDSDMYHSDTSSFDSQNTSDCDLPSNLEWTESGNDSDNFYKYEDNYRRVASSSSFERPTTLPEYLKQQISKQNDCVYDGTSYGSIVYSDDSFPSSISIRSYNSKIEESSLEEISFECPQRMPFVSSGIFLPLSGRKFKQIQNGKYLPMPNSQVCKALKIKIPSVRRDSSSEYSETDSRSARSKLSSSADVDLSTAEKNTSPRNQDNCDSINKTKLTSNEKLEEFDQNSCTSSIVRKMQQEKVYSKKEETIVSNKNNGSDLKHNLEALRHNLSRMDEKQRREFIFKYEVDSYENLIELEDEKNTLVERIKSLEKSRIKTKNPFRFFRNVIRSKFSSKSTKKNNVLKNHLKASLADLQIRMELEQKQNKECRKILRQIEEDYERKIRIGSQTLLHLKHYIVKDVIRAMKLRKQVKNHQNRPGCNIHCLDCISGLHSRKTCEKFIPNLSNSILTEEDGFLSTCPITQLINCKYKELNLDDNELTIESRLAELKKFQKQVQSALFKKSYLKSGQFILP